MKIRRLPQEQAVEWVFVDLSKSEFSHYDCKDWRCRCWVCDKQFKESDNKTVAGTADGPKLVHTKCYSLQEPPLEVKCGQ